MEREREIERNKDRDLFSDWESILKPAKKVVSLMATLTRAHTIPSDRLPV